MKYFTSDLHFGVEENLFNDRRPFKNAKQFDKYILKTWNKTAKASDTIYVLGDFADCDGAGYNSYEKTLPYVKKVKAKVVLIVGNNEERIIKHFFNGDFERFKMFCLDLGFMEVHQNLILNLRGEDFFLVHEPINYKKDMINLFGHNHATSGIYLPCGLNLGCDNNHFRLYSEDDIFNLLGDKKRLWDNDPNLHIKFN
ncbi:MAG: hypothetical protein J6J24_03165 [Clostridia bacterium]|nr:hypothetical protein [Clostridia bacterium]